MDIITLESELIETAILSQFATQMLESWGSWSKILTLTYICEVYSFVYVSVCQISIQWLCHVTCLFLQPVALY